MLKIGQKDCKNQKNSVCCESVSPRNDRSYTHKVSRALLSKYGLNTDNNTIIIIIDILILTGAREAQKALNLHKELQAVKRC